MAHENQNLKCKLEEQSNLKPRVFIDSMEKDKTSCTYANELSPYHQVLESENL